jgi:hypothetical protein
MNGDLFSELVRGIDGRFDFFVVVGLKAGGVVVGAGGCIHFDDVSARGNLLAHHAQYFWDAIGDPSSGKTEAGFVRRVGDIEAVADDEHARADHFAAVDEVAHGDVFVLIGAEIADGGDAGFEGAHRAFAGEEDLDGRRIVGELLEHGFAGSFVGVLGHVRVHIDEAGEAGVFGEVDDLRAGGNVGGVGGDGFDLVVFNDDERVVPQLALGIPEFPEFDGLQRFRGWGSLRGGVAGQKK